MIQHLTELIKKNQKRAVDAISGLLEFPTFESLVEKIALQTYRFNVATN